MARRNLRLKNYARYNRRHVTWDELRLWQALRRKNLGYRFRRQEPIGPYIVDFVCLPKKLIVEADGYSHGPESAQRADHQRDAYFVGRGFTVLRFNSFLIKHDLGGVVNIICEHLEITTPGAHRL